MAHANQAKRLLRKGVLSMTKEQLQALGLTEEQVSKVLEEYGKNSVPKSQFNAKIEEAKALKKSLEESKEGLANLQKELDGIKSTGVGSGAEITALQTQMKALQKKVEDTEKEREAEKSKRIQSEITSSIVDALTKGNAHDPKALASMIASSVSVAEDGSFTFTKGDGTTTSIGEGVEGWLKDHLWAVKDTQKQGAGSNQGTGGKGGKLTRDDFKKMTYAERVELYQTDGKLYSELSKGE